ncbi:guanylate kinase [Mycoplasmopsis maculosa]|uniref:Guanylate kinase n=1 Tax=Mycoplasmopsis maculosa TaxID=114885 RepID=A0A449B4M9_9BACT|nr:guanylate kinase [Mycoplasmopsis maculosa]VEU75488.1 guanylate kinase [Mycoplasmopsis maculosa]
MNIDFNKKPIVIFTGPSGVGKGTIEKILFEDEELRLKLSCSATTRKPREGEVNGIHYFFISKEEFKSKIDSNSFLEYSFHFDNYYGTLFEEIDRIHNSNKIPFLEIETNGAKQILKNVLTNKQYKIITLFLLPPSIEELKSRIENRNTENDEAIQKRLLKAEEEISDSNIFQYKIINDDALKAAKDIKRIILNEIEKK